MKNFLILPNQLFDISYLKKINITPKDYKIILYEHPHYFTSLNFNKKKLLLHFSSMLNYKVYLKHHKYQVNYIKYNKKLTINNYEMFNSADNLNDIKGIKEYDNPNYLLTNELREKYMRKTDKYIFNNFYMWSKKELKILENVKSQDKDNRNRMPKNTIIPKLEPLSRLDLDLIKLNINRINKEFNSNYGNTDNFVYPITHKTAKKFLTSFIKNKFDKFGDYQDFIKKDESFLFHSILSSSINIGLLNPIDIINEIQKYKNKIPLNSYEGFIRQLFWREYQLYCYKTIDYKKELKTPYLESKERINKSWYTGNRGIEIIDDTIKKAFDTGYLHHIERLMVMGNYMSLIGLKPEDGYKWFMEFSIDSYDWVMNQNVYDMVFFVTTKTMRKPYVSSSNYLIKMSDYKKGDWSKKWDKLYEDFQKRNLDKLWKYRYSFPGLKKYKK